MPLTDRCGGIARITISKRRRMGTYEKWKIAGSDVDFDGAEAKLSRIDGGFESGHYNGIEFGTSQRTDAVHRIVQFHRGLIRTVSRHGIQCICHADDSRHHRNLIALQTVGVTAAVHVLVVELDAR